MGCAECCDCWCHGNLSNEDGTDREDAEALRAEIRRLNLESAVIHGDKEEGTAQLKCDSPDLTFCAVLSDEVATVRWPQASTFALLVTRSLTVDGDRCLACCARDS
jgi:hypothetical protein